MEGLNMDILLSYRLSSNLGEYLSRIWFIVIIILPFRLCEKRLHISTF